MGAWVSSGDLCVAETPTEPAGETQIPIKIGICGAKIKSELKKRKITRSAPKKLTATKIRHETQPMCRTEKQKL